MKKIKCLVITAAAATMIVGSSIFAHAAEQNAQASAKAAESSELPESTKTVTSENGVLTLMLPSEDWQETTNDSACVTYSDGKDSIIFNHYKVGTEKPEVVEPDNANVRVFQEITANKDNYFSITGFCTCDDDEEFKALVDSIKSAVINEDKIKDETHKVVTSNYSLEAANQTMYVSCDSLNVRPTGSKDGAPVGSLSKGTAVNVTGIVKNNGKATGWVKIKCGNLEGYVNQQYLSKTAVSTPTPTPQPTANTIEHTGNAMDVYGYSFECQAYIPTTIYECTDGVWRDQDNVLFWKTAEDEWSSNYGGTYFSYDPDEEAITKTGDQMVLYKANGEAFMVYEYADGSWKDDNMMEYTDIQNNQWIDKDGNIFYSVDPTKIEDDTDPNYYQDDTDYDEIDSFDDAE